MDDSLKRSVTVYKLNAAGRPVWSYPAEIIEVLPNGVRLQAHFNRDDMALGFATFRRGDRFIEYFYTDRWYNVFAVYDRDSEALKGWYCNICRPAQIEAASVRAADLALDLWVTPAGGVTVLDEDAFRELALPAAEAAAARRAVEALQELAARGALPR